MKRQLFFFATLFIAVISFSSFSDDNCKYKVQKVDKFTGENEIELEPILLLKKFKSDVIKVTDLSMVLRKKGQYISFELIFGQAGMSNKSVPRFIGRMDNKLVCLLKNGSQVELPMEGDMPDFIKSKTVVHFSVSQESFELLLKSKITDIRAVSSVNPFDFKIDDEVNTKAFFKCIE